MDTVLLITDMKRPKPIPVLVTHQAVEALREKLGITVVEFCRILGISMATYYSWSQPGRCPMGSTAVLLGLIMEKPFDVYRRIRRLIEPKEDEESDDGPVITHEDVQGLIDSHDELK